MSYQFKKLLGTGFNGNAPATEKEIAAAEKDLGISFPEDFREFLKVNNGGEGLIGESYVIFWNAEEIVEFNRSYEAEEYLPDSILFGSNGGGECCAFDTQTSPYPIVMVPFVGMDWEYAESVADNFVGFLKDAGAEMEEDTEVGESDEPSLAGQEVFEVQPVILGGSPTDPENKTILTRQQHIEAVRYWNKVIKDLREQQEPEG